MARPTTGRSGAKPLPKNPKPCVKRVSPQRPCHGSLLIILTVGYATLAVAIGMNWMIALGLMTVFGIVSGLVMNLGGRWMATVVLMVVLALVVQLFIALFGLVL